MALLATLMFATSCDRTESIVAPLETLPQFALSAGGGTWTTKAPLPAARAGLATGVANGVLYAVGGADDAIRGTVAAYNPGTNAWTSRASMPTARWNLGVGVVNGILYAVGGGNADLIAAVEAYNPATNSWTTKAPMPTPRTELAVGVVNGILYAVGGRTLAGALATVEAYDPASNTWTTKAPMPTAREGLAVGVVNGILYAVGSGLSGTTVEAYDPATNRWTTKAPMPTARAHLAVGVVNGILYAIGGSYDSFLATVEAYDPATNTWTARVPMSTPRGQLAVGEVNGILYAVGGFNGAYLATNEAFSPGKQFYLSPTGSDANACTATAPCFTMERLGNPNTPGLEKLAPGDVVHFASGTYNWPKPQIVSAAGMASARVTYISDATWGAKLIISGTVNNVCGLMKNTGDYVDIIGLDMTYSPQGSCAQGLMQDGNYGRIIGNRVHDLTGPDGTGYGGILVDCCAYTLTGNQVIGNVVDNIGPPNGLSNIIHGIYLAGPTNSAINNIVTRASAACISSYHGATNLIITNNVLANCGRYGITVSADSFAVPGGVRNDFTTVSNNIIVNIGQIGVHEYCEPPSVGPARVGPNNVYYNNIFYNNPEHIRHCDGDPSNEDGTIVLTAAEFAGLFVNYTGDRNGDYHLRAGARAIDTGTTRCAPGVTGCAPLADFDGVARPQGTAWDIGAYEFKP